MKANKSDFSTSVLNWGTKQNAEWEENTHIKYACDKFGRKLKALPMWTDEQIKKYQTITRKYTD